MLMSPHLQSAVIGQYAHYFLLLGAAVCSLFSSTGCASMLIMFFYRMRQYVHYFLLQVAEVCSLFSSTRCCSLLTIFFYRVRQYAHYVLLQDATICSLFSSTGCESMLTIFFYMVTIFLSIYDHFFSSTGCPIYYACNFYSTRSGIGILTRYPRFILLENVCPNRYHGNLRWWIL
jgi:hypothetical protein